MATMKIETFWHHSSGCKLSEGQPAGVVTYPNGGGYPSLEAMQQELIRRFPYHNPVRVPDGIRMESHGGQYQIITFNQCHNGDPR